MHRQILSLILLFAAKFAGAQQITKDLECSEYFLPVEVPQTSDEVLFSVLVSDREFKRRLRALASDPSARNYRQLVMARYGRGEYELARAIAREAAERYPETELRIYAQFFLVRNAEMRAFQDAAALGDVEARAILVARELDALPEKPSAQHDKLFWQMEAWGEFKPRQCWVALKSLDLMPAKICLANKAELEGPENIALLCQLHKRVRTTSVYDKFQKEQAR